MAQPQQKKNPYEQAAKNYTPPDYTTFHKMLERGDSLIHSLGTPFPNAPNWDTESTQPIYGPGWEQILKGAANTGAAALMFPYQHLVARPVFGMADMGNDLTQWMMHGNPPPEAAAAPAKSTAAPAPAPAPQGMPNLGLDKSYSIPGSGLPMPEFPQMNNPLESPDFTKADSLLELARPKLDDSQFHQQELDAGWEGVGAAAGAIDPRTPPLTALAQILSGYTAGRGQSEKEHTNMRLMHEQKVEQYNLQLAGVEQGRAEALARAKVEQSKVANEIASAKFNQQMQIYNELKPVVQVLGDGSLVSISRDPKGGMKVERMGQQDALNASIALANARQQGVKNQSLAEMQVMQTFGPLGAQIVALNRAAGISGSLEYLIPENMREQYNEELMNRQAEVQGLSGTAQASRWADIVRSVQMKYLLGDPYARTQINQMAGH